MAAHRAVAVYAYREAVGHLERCLRVQEVLDPDDKARRCDLLLALGEALRPAGEAQRALDTAAAEALVLAEGLGDRGRGSAACRVAFYSVLQRGGLTGLAGPEASRWSELAD